MSADLPALQVVVPLIGALLCGLLRRPTSAWLLALAVSWLMLPIAGALLHQAVTTGPISYHLGNWEPPWGIEYRVDAVNGFVLVLVSAVGAVMMPYARRSVAAEVPADKVAWFYAMYLLCLTGLLGITITGDAFNAFVFLEISSLSTYVLIAMGRDRRALLASYQYLIMGTIGATFYVIGIGLLYTMTGTLNMADLAVRLQSVETVRPVLAGLAFLTVGICLKLALFPLHVWLPNAYAYAPSFATAFLAASATKVAIYLLMRFFFSIFGVGLVFETLPVSDAMLALSIAAMFGASLVAVFQENVKRMLAYSSVAQIGYITFGIALATRTGLTGAIVHLFNHALMKGALFMLVGGMVLRAGSARLHDLAGIGRRMPLTTAGFVLAGISLIGSPITVGFISKWYLVLAAWEKDEAWLAALVLLSSVISLVYFGRIIEFVWFRPASPSVVEAQDPPLSMILPSWILVGACIWFGIDTSLTVGMAGKAADALLAGLR
jgi:multicomponent Na+:H+ antiporter subunit D